ncbi:MAG: hypothetical protein Q7U89_05815, partial [Coriobacteriia bacterium]|nr:hypothetical protein [Coriobacteriia bacterium]
MALAIAGATLSESYPPAKIVDRAASAGAIVALAGCLLLPFVEFRPNRIVDGRLLHLWQCAGVWAWVLLSVLALSLAAALLPSRYRGRGLIGCAVLSFGALLFALGSATTRLMPT